MEEKTTNTEEVKENQEKTCSCNDKQPKENACCCHEKHGKHEKHTTQKKLEEQIKKLEEEKKNYLEKLKYSQAELINYRKRKEEQVSTALKYANQDLILEILPVLDNFERAISLDDNNLTDELSKFLAGFKLMYATLNDVLKQFGVEEIDAYQKPFDPNLMEALMVDHDKDFEDGTVLEVLLKGYKLKDRVIRPCSVKVNQLEGEDKNE